MRDRWHVCTRCVAASALVISALAAACSPRETLRQSGRGATASGDVSISAFPNAELSPGGYHWHDGFERLSSGVVFPSGGAAVTDPRVGVVYFFDRQGNQIASVDRLAKGGPRFRAVWMGRCHGDSVFAWDPVGGRVAVFTVSGRLGRQYTPPPRSGQFACAPDGRIAVLGEIAHVRTPHSPASLPRDTVPFYVLDSRGAATGFAMRVAASENRPLGRRTIVALGPGRVYLGQGDSGLVVAHDVGGGEIGEVRVAQASRTVAPGQYRLALHEAVANFRSDEDQEQALQYLQRIPPPAALPPYSALFADARGRLWVDESELGDSTTVLRGFSSNGKQVAQVNLPPNIRVLDVDSTYLLGAYRTLKGREHAVVYHLTWQR